MKKFKTQYIIPQMKRQFIIFAIFGILMLTTCSNETYDFFVTSSDPDSINIESVVSANKAEDYPHLTQTTEKGWLVLFYICADYYRKYSSYPNHPNDSRYNQMSQIGRGLKKIKLADGKTPKSAFANVTAAGLWDGYNKDEKLNTYLPYTYLFEFKYPEQTYTADIAKSYKNFTIDYTKEITESENDWLNGKQEANSADVNTLKNFLTWALQKYNSDNSKEVVLILAGDGGGSFGEEIGSYIPPSRALCKDASSDSYYLTAKEITEALSANGFSSLNKLPLLILDSSFSSSLEDAFEYKDTILSLVASPSEVPCAAIDFNYLLQCFTKKATPYSIGTSLVNIYANKNYGSNAETDKGTASLSYIDLTQIDELTNKVNIFADHILTCKNQKDIDYKYSVFECLTNEDFGFLNYDDEAPNYMTDSAMFYKAEYMHEVENIYLPDTTNIFHGYFYQFDLGYLAFEIYKSVSTKQGLDTIYYSCDEINKALKKAIISSWRNGTGAKKGLYTSLDSDFRFGLTITGPARTVNGDDNNYLQPYNFSDFSFKNYKETGKETSANWNELLRTVFPEQFIENTYPHYKNSSSS